MLRDRRRWHQNPGAEDAPSGDLYLIHDEAGQVLWTSPSLAHRCQALGLGHVASVTQLLSVLDLERQVIRRSELADPYGNGARLLVLRPRAGTPTCADLPEPGEAFHALIGRSWQIQEGRDLIVRAARSTFPVLITGETGSGKELFARAVHELSPRVQGPFVAINCAAIPVSLAEAELFGYEQGAFTDAARAGRAGKFEQAHRGTLFLDELAELPASLQAKLLRALQTSEIERIGGANPVRVDVRIVTATNRDLKAAVVAGDFRADLFYRLNVIAIHVPALRERRDDIPTFVEHYVTAICRELGMPPKRVPSETIALLEAHPWPGNVRELINVLKRVIVSTDAREIAPDDIARVLRHGEPAQGMDPRRAVPISRERMLEMLDAVGGNRSEAAKRLGIHRSTLYELLARFDLPRRRREP